MPLLSVLNLGSLLSALGLVTSLLKPVPIVGDLVPGLLGTLIPIVNQTLSNLPILAAVPGDGGDGDDDGSASLTGVTMPVCNNIVSYAKSNGPLQPFALFDLAMSNVFRYRQQQSVNLGSWFVQEAWMNPSLFVCAAGNKSSELDVAMGYGGNVDSARMSLEMHWDTWIKEEDFAYLQKIGINTVRLPIGFWSLGPTYTQGTPFESVSDAYVNSWPRIVRAINWAAKYGLGVLVDLHGAPGSQNGQGHGGTSDEVVGLFDSPTYMAQTINIITFLTQQLVEVTNVVGIELLNEPSNVDGLPDFYTKALQTLRQVSPSAQKFPFYIHDGFDMSRFADYVAARQDSLVLDHHQYFVFAPSDPTESSASLAADIKSGVSSDLISAAKRSRGNLVVDEFSCALSSQALNTETDKAAARATYCTGQMETYANGTAGWSFWSYRTESCPTDNDWCFLKAVGNSLPTSFFSYPGNYPIQPAPGTVSASNPLIIPGILSPLSPIALQLKAIPPLLSLTRMGKLSNTLFTRTSLRVVATFVLVFAFGLLLLDSSFLSSPSPSSSPSSLPLPQDDGMATWSRYDRIPTHRKPPDPPKDQEGGKCLFQDPLGHLEFANRIPSTPSSSPSSSSPLLDSSSPLDGRSTRSSGVLRVDESNEGEMHPMLLLIREGATKFMAKLEGQSSTLEQAVREYESRNEGRSPPQGFDKWFEFAQSKDVLFPDEFDQISTSFLPWLKISPAERYRRLRETEHRRFGQDGVDEASGKQNLVRLISDGMGGLGWEPLLSPSTSPRYPPPSRSPKRSSKSPYVPTHTLKPNKRTKALLDLLAPIRDLLPRFSIVINCADQPMVLLSFSQKAELSSPPQQARDFAPSSGSNDQSDVPVTWEAVCRGVVPNNASDSSEGFSFVASRSLANDPCVHPIIRENHGLFLDQGKATFKHISHGRLLPIWSQSSTSHHSDFLVPAIGIDGRFPQPGKKDVAWSFKKAQVFWRGSATGMSNVLGQPPAWLKSHRSRLHLLANDLTPGASENVCAVAALGELAVKTAWKKTVAAWMDVKLASTIFWQWFSWWPELGQQCSWGDGSCSQLKSYLKFALKAPEDEVDLYKFALDVDGNSWSARFFRLLASKSLVIKSTIFVEWNSETHPDWFGYVPSHWSFRDLHSIVAFFKGPIDGEGRYQDFEAYDEIARVMAENGKCFQQRAWRIEDMQIYMLRALLEYARMFNEEDADGMDLGL